MRPDWSAPAVRGSSVFALAALLALTALPMGAAGAPPHPVGKTGAVAIGNLDIRVTNRRDLAQVLAGNQVDARKTGLLAAAQIQALRQGVARLRAVSPGAEVSFSPLSGAAEVVRNPLGALTGPAPGRPGVDIVRDFLHANADLYGLSDADLAALRCMGESVNPRSGLRMVRCEQTVHGLPVFQSDTRITLDRSGQIIRAVGLLAPHAPANALAVSPQVTAQQALAAAMKSVGIDLDPAAMRLEDASPDGAKGEVAAGDPRIQGGVASQLVYFPLAPGVLVPAWQQVTFTKGPGDWMTLVDAGTGILLWRKNIRSYVSTQEARFSVYVQNGTIPAENPAPHSPTTVAPGSGMQFPEILRTGVNMSAAQNVTASPNGWIDDNGITTTGNNVDAYLDTNNDQLPDVNGRPIGNVDIAGRQRDFLGAGYAYDPAPLGGDPDDGTAPSDPQFQRGAVTHLFYLANWFHDQLYTYGFDEPAGNFQQTNFTGGGLGGDRVLAEAQDGSGPNTASFATPPDGVSGRLQIPLFDAPAPDRDGSLDATVVFHELAHGLTNRLVGNSSGLVWLPGIAMGEGWSDFYALSLLFSSNAYDPDKEYALGAYTSYKFAGLLTDNYLYGIRRYPYSTNHVFSPITWGNYNPPSFSGGIPVSPLDATIFGPATPSDPQNLGEIWANTLWEVRSCIIADPSPGAANGDVPTGNATTLSIVTDALKMTPLNPSYTDARDAMLDADCAANACANDPCIWQGFTNRGLGMCQGYCTSAQSGIVGEGAFFSFPASFSMPYLTIDDLSISDPLGNHNGGLDPGEEIQLTVELKNPWRLATKGVPSATATLTSSTPGVTILTGSSTYPAIAAQASVSGSPFVLTVPASAACGQSLHFTLTTNSALGTRSLYFTLRVGAPAGNGAPVTYTRTLPGGLAISDNDFFGVSDTLTITDDLEIADLDFRLDDLTHTFTSDLVVGLEAPGRYGTSLIYRRGLSHGDGDGDNFVNTVIDGDSINDLNQSGAADAPYTGDWLPAFNSPSWDSLGMPSDPVDQFFFMEGGSTQGDWKIHVFDQASQDIGRLNQWSLIVTPKAFTCSTFTRIAATKAASGDFVAGGTVAYTIVLTNTGTGAQPDGPGDELTDLLPAGLTLVNATANSGAVAVLGNTVTWNGAIPASGTVTITITATVDMGTAGTTLINQGTTAFDADNNGTNEAAGVTDDPATSPAGDGTAVVVQSVAEVPALSPLGFAALGLLLAGAGWVLLRRVRRELPPPPAG